MTSEWVLLVAIVMVAIVAIVAIFFGRTVRVKTPTAKVELGTARSPPGQEPTLTTVETADRD